jgi:proline iminopeptidase
VGAGDGAVLWTSTSGSGRPVVLCHGGPGMADYLEPVAALLDDLVLVHRWDQRGAGRSDHVGPFSVARCVADLEELRRHFGHDRWVVVGHSWGANLAIHYAQAHPERVTAVAYLCGTGLEWINYRAEHEHNEAVRPEDDAPLREHEDRKSTRLNSSHNR